MAERGYLLPGTEVEILDYQIKAPAIETPGDVVVLLGVMPDEMVIADGTVPDPAVPGSGTKIVPFPTNSPILITNRGDFSKLLKGDNILNNIGVQAESDIANILDVINTKKPIAVCKISLKNGKNPDINNLHEMYEALENAYDNLANYPAGLIIPIGVSFDDEFGIPYPCRNYKNTYIAGDANIEKILTFDPMNFVPTAEYDWVFELKVEDDADNPGTKIGKVYKGSTTPLPEKIALDYDSINLVYKVSAPTNIVVEAGELYATLKEGAIFGDEAGTVQQFRVEIEITQNNFYRVSNVYQPEKTISEIFVKEGKSIDNVLYYNPLVAYTYEVELKKETIDGLEFGTVYVDGNPLQSTDGTGMLKLNITAEGNLELDTEVTIAEGVIIKITQGAKFGTVLTVGGVDYTNTYKINTTPEKIDGRNTDIVYRAGKFCRELTEGLNECRVYFGVKPPKNNTPKAIRSQVAKLIGLNKVSQGFEEYITADKKVDLGMYITVVVGTQQVNGIGGITNFPEAKLVAFSGAKLAVIEKTYAFKEGDSVEFYMYKGSDITTQSNRVISVAQDEGITTLTLVDEIDTKGLNNINRIYVQNINKKDNHGSYVASMYSGLANDMFPNKAPVNAQLPGVCQITYTKGQLIALRDAKYTTVNKASTSPAGIVIDTPTMARTASDFTDQATVGLMFYFLRKMRQITEKYRGERFSDPNKRIVFEDELKNVLKSEVNNTINRFELNVDYRLLTRRGIILANFGFEEEKTLKMVRLTSRLL